MAICVALIAASNVTEQAASNMPIFRLVDQLYGCYRSVKHHRECGRLASESNGSHAINMVSSASAFPFVVGLGSTGKSTNVREEDLVEGNFSSKSDTEADL